MHNPTFKRVTIGCCEVGGGGGGVVGGVGVVCGDGVDRGVGGVDCQASISGMIIKGTRDTIDGVVWRGSFVWWKGVRVGGVRIFESRGDQGVDAKGNDYWSVWQRQRQQRVRGIDHPCYHNKEGFDGDGFECFIRTDDPVVRRVIGLRRERIWLVRWRFMCRLMVEISGLLSLCGQVDVDYQSAYQGIMLKLNTPGPKSKKRVVNAEVMRTPAAFPPTKRLWADYGTLELNLRNHEVDSIVRSHPQPFTGRSGSEFAAGSIHAEEVRNVGLEEIYVPEVDLNMGLSLYVWDSCANMMIFSLLRLSSKLFRGMLAADCDADFTSGVVCASKRVIHQHLLNVVAGTSRKALLASADRERNAGGRRVDFNFAVCDLRVLNFPLLQELSNKKDASTWDVMDLLRLDDAMGCYWEPSVVLTLVIDADGWCKMERNLVERLPFLKDVFVSLDHPLSAEALIEPPVVVPATNALSTMVIVPYSGPSISVEDYENPDLVDVVPKNVTLGPEGEENIDASTGGDLAFSKLDDEARDVVL
ncbi:hypothetical protein Tco_0969771 [Tanacetum coccineum]